MTCRPSVQGAWSGSICLINEKRHTFGTQKDRLYETVLLSFTIYDFIISCIKRDGSVRYPQLIILCYVIR